jgi:hypothetical protein
MLFHGFVDVKNSQGRGIKASQQHIFDGDNIEIVAAVDIVSYPFFVAS